MKPDMAIARPRASMTTPMARRAFAVVGLMSGLFESVADCPAAAARESNIHPLIWIPTAPVADVSVALVIVYSSLPGVQ